MASDVCPAFIPKVLFVMPWTGRVCICVCVSVWTCALAPHVGRRLVDCCSHPEPSQPQCRNYSDLPGTSSQLLLMTQGQPIIQIKHAEGTESTSSCLHHTLIPESCRPPHLSPQRLLYPHPLGAAVSVKPLTHSLTKLINFVYDINHERCFSDVNIVYSFTL